MPARAGKGARQVAGTGLAFLKERWTDFREESPYFQAKVGLVAAWLLISTLTIAIAPPATIPFIVEQQAIPFGASKKTILVILNQDGGDIPEGIVEVHGTLTEFDGKEIPGVWATKVVAIPEGVKTTLSTEKFFDKKGIPPGYNLHIDSVRILDGDETVFTGAPPVVP